MDDEMEPSPAITTNPNMTSHSMDMGSDESESMKVPRSVPNDEEGEDGSDVEVMNARQSQSQQKGEQPGTEEGMGTSMGADVMMASTTMMMTTEMRGSGDMASAEGGMGSINEGSMMSTMGGGEGAVESTTSTHQRTHQTKPSLPNT